MLIIKQRTKLEEQAIERLNTIKPTLKNHHDNIFDSEDAKTVEIKNKSSSGTEFSFTISRNPEDIAHFVYNQTLKKQKYSEPENPTRYIEEGCLVAALTDLKTNVPIYTVLISPFTSIETINKKVITTTALCPIYKNNIDEDTIKQIETDFKDIFSIEVGKEPLPTVEIDETDKTEEVIKKEKQAKIQEVVQSEINKRVTNELDRIKEHIANQKVVFEKELFTHLDKTCNTGIHGILNANKKVVCQINKITLMDPAASLSYHTTDYRYGAYRSSLGLQ